MAGSRRAITKIPPSAAKGRNPGVGRLAFGNPRTLKRNTVKVMMSAHGCHGSRIVKPATLLSRGGLLAAPIGLLLCLIPMGCKMNGLPDKAPSASKSIVAPPNSDATRVLSCSADTIAGLARKDDRWDARITRRDATAGLIETGHFEKENESGFRARVRFDSDRNIVRVDLKGGGAYFVDLGVDAALAEFSATLEQCLSAAA